MEDWKTDREIALKRPCLQNYVISKYPFKMESQVHLIVEFKCILNSFIGSLNICLSHPMLGTMRGVISWIVSLHSVNLAIFPMVSRDIQQLAIYFDWLGGTCKQIYRNVFLQVLWNLWIHLWPSCETAGHVLAHLFQIEPIALCSWLAHIWIKQSLVDF